jgi:hypothetical protein
VHPNNSLSSFNAESAFDGSIPWKLSQILRVVAEEDFVARKKRKLSILQFKEMQEHVGIAPIQGAKVRSSNEQLAALEVGLHWPTSQFLKPNNGHVLGRAVVVAQILEEEGVENAGSLLLQEVFEPVIHWLHLILASLEGKSGGLDRDKVATGSCSANSSNWHVRKQSAILQEDLEGRSRTWVGRNSNDSPGNPISPAFISKQKRAGNLTRNWLDLNVEWHEYFL